MTEERRPAAAALTSQAQVAVEQRLPVGRAGHRRGRVQQRGGDGRRTPAGVQLLDQRRDAGRVRRRERRSRDLDVARAVIFDREPGDGDQLQEIERAVIGRRPGAQDRVLRRPALSAVLGLPLMAVAESFCTWRAPFRIVLGCGAAAAVALGFVRFSSGAESAARSTNLEAYRCILMGRRTLCVLALGFVFNLVFGAIFGTVGGLIGGAVFKHEPAAPPPPPTWNPPGGGIGGPSGGGYGTTPGGGPGAPVSG